MLETKLQQAVALHNGGQLARAKALYQEILGAQPEHADALHLLGVIAAVTGNPGEAVRLIGRAIEIAPHNAAAHNNHGAALQALGRWDAALASYERAAALDLRYADPHYNRGNLFKDLHRSEAALASYDKAIALRPGYAEAYCNRGIVLADLQRPESALESYERAIAIRPQYSEAHYNRGNVLCALRRWSAALDSYERAIGLNGNYAEAYSNRAFALKELHRIEEALVSCNRAVAIKPDFAQAHANRGSVLVALNRLDEALASYDRALALEPNEAAFHVNRGVARLLAGNYRDGWADYEWRWRDKAALAIHAGRNWLKPLWLGETPLAGRSILLHSEQGYGDTLQFCRYARLVADLGARVILEIPQALASLLRSLEGVSQWVVQGEPLPDFDFHCPLLSLPLALKTSLENVPASVPYLNPSPVHRHAWKARLGERRGPRVGLVWSGGFRPGQPELWSVNERRNVPVTKLKTLQHAGIEYYSLQKGESAASEPGELAAQGWNGPKLTDFTQEIRDFSDTAALIEQLDLVISVDTSTAHLAGALAKPVWILNRFDTCWRWLRDRSDSPWYPTARLYRQPRAGDWDTVLRQVRADLSAFFKI